MVEMKESFAGQTVLIAGGNGSFGNTILHHLLLTLPEVPAEPEAARRP